MKCLSIFILLSPIVVISQRFQVDIGEEIIVCEARAGDTTEVSLVIKGGKPPYKISWFIKDQQTIENLQGFFGYKVDSSGLFTRSDSQTSAIYQDNVHDEDQSIFIFVKVQDNKGRIAVDSVTYSEGYSVYTQEILQANIKQGDSVQLRSNVSRSWPIVKYEWSPANSLSDQYNSQPIAKPKSSTQYILNVWDEKGCNAKDGFNIIVE